MDIAMSEYQLKKCEGGRTWINIRIQTKKMEMEFISIIIRIIRRISEKILKKGMESQQQF